MKLSKIHIYNYRKLKNCVIEFDKKQTVFVGANNSGKTSAMQAIITFLKENNRFTANDFTLSNWVSLNEVAEKWIAESSDSSKPVLDDISDYLPTMDVWIDVTKNDAYLVRDLIPSFEWKGKTIGVRIVYAPNDIERLHDDFKEVYNHVRKLEKKDHKTLYPVSLWDYLSKNKKLHEYFYCRYYILDIDKETEDTGKLHIPAVEYDTKDPLSKLFKIDSIEAQREFSDPKENDNNGQNNLSKQLQSYYEKQIQQKEIVSAEDVEIFEAADNANKVCDEKLKKAFSVRIDELKNIRYPGFQNPEIKIHSKINIKDTLTHDSAVQFLVAKDKEELVLPEKYNGLGYQNLISMYFKLIQFREEWLHEGKTDDIIIDEDNPIEPIHLVLIEEPEAHLHAQAQQVFVKKACEALTNSNKLKEENIYTTQVVLSTHSNHIVKELDLNCMRYFRREKSKESKIPVSKVESLKDVFGEDEETRRFVSRYIKLNHCDFFFADAVIMVEGSGERILMNRFLDKSNVNDNYISVIEVNGSHAHRFKPLIERLNIFTLIVTDIDSQSMGNKGKMEKKFTQKGKKQISNNDTIKEWLGIKDVDRLLELKDEDKIKGNVRIAYQTGIPIKFKGKARESIAYPYTFEDSVALTNYQLFIKKDLECSGMVKHFHDILISATNATSCCKDLFEKLKSANKAPFAISLLFMEEFEQLKTPAYIEEGLDWLNQLLNSNK